MYVLSTNKKNIKIFLLKIFNSLEFDFSVKVSLICIMEHVVCVKFICATNVYVLANSEENNNIFFCKI